MAADVLAEVVATAAVVTSAAVWERVTVAGRAAGASVVATREAWREAVVWAVSTVAEDWEVGWAEAQKAVKVAAAKAAAESRAALAVLGRRIPSSQRRPRNPAHPERR